MTKLTKEEKAERERIRAQMAFSTIATALKDIVREEVNHFTIDMWRAQINRFRSRGDWILRKDLLINAETVDPFNADAPRHRALAEWFVEQWQHFKRPEENTIHVRGLHYKISGPALTPDAIRFPPDKYGNPGKIYENTDPCWATLERAGKYARYLGLLSFDDFEDRRTDEPRVREFPITLSRGLSTMTYGGIYADTELDEFPPFPDYPIFPHMPNFPSLPHFWFSMRGQQQYRIEVWIEKSTQDKILIPFCAHNRISLVTATGEISASAMWRAVKRAEEYKRYGITTVILYLSDFDPAGKSMPVAASRKLEFIRFIRGSTVSMRLYPIVLTYDQCQQYQLPRTPIKASDMRRSGFEYRYGTGATELDALEALHPGELVRILDGEIQRFHDRTLGDRVRKREREIDKELSELQSEIHSRHNLDTFRQEYDQVETDLASIAGLHEAFESEFDDLVDAYAALERRYNRVVRTPFNDWFTNKLVPLVKKMRTTLDAVEDEMNERMPDVHEYKIPRAAEVPLDDDCLYDSSRGYIPQLAVYKKFAGKFEHLVEDESEEEE